MTPELAVGIAALSALSAALSAMGLAYLASIDRRVGALEAHFINRSREAA